MISRGGAAGLSFVLIHAAVYVLNPACSYVSVAVVSLVRDLRGRKAFEVKSPYKSMITTLHSLVCSISEESAITVTLTIESFFQ